MDKKQFQDQRRKSTSHCKQKRLFHKANHSAVQELQELQEGTKYSSECTFNKEKDFTTIEIPPATKIPVLQRFSARDGTVVIFDLETTGHPLR